MMFGTKYGVDYLKGSVKMRKSDLINRLVEVLDNNEALNNSNWISHGDMMKDIKELLEDELKDYIIIKGQIME